MDMSESSVRSKYAGTADKKAQRAENKVYLAGQNGKTRMMTNKVLIEQVK